MKTEEQLKFAIDTYADTVKRISFMYLKNPHDTEDIFQNVFLKYMLYSERFKNAEHEKAWIIRVTVNCCKDFLKTRWKKNVDLTDIPEDISEQTKEYSEVFEAIRELPVKNRDTVYLYYYEGYSAKEIAKILKKPENTIYSLLTRSREMLKNKLGGEMLGQ